MEAYSKIMGRKYSQVDRTCEWCEINFKVRLSAIESGRGKFCSKKCRYKALSQQMKKGVINLHCKYCNKEFTLPIAEAKWNPGKYCSRDCCNKAKCGIRTSVIKKCEVCGKEFKAIQAYLKQGFAKYCSRKCAGIGHRGKDENKWTSRFCERCGKKFDIRITALNHGAGRFCSRACFKADTSYGETSIEKLMREAIERRGIFHFQEYQFGRYTADFYLPVHNVVIECDGIYWHALRETRERDARKDKTLEALGITVFRFNEDDIHKDADKCIKIALRGVKQYPRRKHD